MSSGSALLNGIFVGFGVGLLVDGVFPPWLLLGESFSIHPLVVGK